MYKNLRADLTFEVKKGNRLSIVVAYFFIYAFQELKIELESIEEFCFYIFHIYN